MISDQSPSGAGGGALCEMATPLPHEQSGGPQLPRPSIPPLRSIEKLTCGKDLVWLAALPPLTVLAWLLPLSFCEQLGVLAAHLSYDLRPDRYTDFAQMFRELLPGPPDDRAVAALVKKAMSLHHLERFLLLRQHRPIGRRPKVRIEGREHVERALAAGRGAILWVKTSSFSDVMTKAAFHQDGFPVSHLSRHTHGGFSTSRLGVKLLNWIRTSIECRYLAQRVVIDPRNPKAALQRLAELLSRNQLVSITVGAEASRITWVAMCGASVPLAGGAAKLAIGTGAPLLPVFTERVADGSFLVTVEAPLQGPETGPDASAGEDSIARMLCRYAALLGVYFERLPEQYHCLGLYLAGAAEKRRMGDRAAGPLAELSHDPASGPAARHR